MKKKIANLLYKLSRINTASNIELMYQIDKRAMEQSVRFIERNSESDTNYFENHWDLRKSAFEKIVETGLLLEFGVNKGASANFFSGLLTLANDARMYYGFDSFEGLSEDWGGTSMKKGHFDRKAKPPTLNNNVQCVIGDIMDTLEPFLTEHQENIAFIHIDTDTYTPCFHVLKLCKPHLVEGSVILFDELVGYPNYQSHELKALNEVLPRSSYKYLSFGISHPRANLVKSAILITDTSQF